METQNYKLCKLCPFKLGIHVHKISKEFRIKLYLLFSILASNKKVRRTRILLESFDC